MFSPDADISPYRPPPKSTIEVSKTGPKVISHKNTRLVEEEHKIDSSGLSEPPSPTRSRIEAAISGTPCTLICSLLFHFEADNLQ
jgi:protein DGCR14